MPKKLTQEEFITRAREVHGDKYDYSLVEYKSTHTKVKIVCPIHGVFEQEPNQHLAGAGCPKCAGKMQTTEDFIRKAREIHGDLYDYSKVDYINCDTPVTIICKQHGEFQQAPDLHLRGHGCSKCSLKAQRKVYDRLVEALGLNILFEVGVNTISWIKPYRLDMYIPDYNIAIEYDGLQHFKPIAYWGGEEALLSTQERDQIKAKLCAQNDCVLFRIAYNYTDQDFSDLITNIKNIIQNDHQ